MGEFDNSLLRLILEVTMDSDYSRFNIPTRGAESVSLQLRLVTFN